MESRENKKEIRICRTFLCGHGGGLAFLRKDRNSASLLGFSRNQVNILSTRTNHGDKWDSMDSRKDRGERNHGSC